MPLYDDRHIAIVNRFVDLVLARAKGDYLGAADAHRELERLGVRIRFQRKAVDAVLAERAKECHGPEQGEGEKEKPT